VSFTVGVETEESTLTQAFRSNSAKLSAVLVTLKAKGVQPKELQTSDLEVTSRDDEGKKLRGFRVSNQVTVTREDPASAAELLEAAITAGANAVGGLRFFVADPSKVRQQGLELAYRDAYGKAQSLASLANQDLGDALCIQEGSSWGNGNWGIQTVNTGATFSAAPMPFQAGTEGLGFSVTVTYELKARPAR
jgi:uncharacterized protein YggE